MIDFVEMSLEVISRPFNIELLRLCHFVVFLQLLLDMVPLMQILLNTDLCICRLKKKFDRIFSVTLRSFQGHFSYIFYLLMIVIFKRQIYILIFHYLV